MGTEADGVYPGRGNRYIGRPSRASRSQRAAVPDAPEPQPAREPGEPAARARGYSVAWVHLPTALMAGVAALQIFLAATSDLTPWKGGGFGMFSTTDRGRFRRVRAFVADAGGERRVSVPGELEFDRLRAQALPSAAALERLARGVARASGAPVARIEVWRIAFDRDDLALRPRLLRAGRWPAKAP